MPVHADAMVAAGLTRDADDARSVDLAGQRHVATTKDQARFLSDILPLRPLRQVVSFGDLVLGVGTMDLVVGLLRTPPRARVRGDRGRVEGPMPTAAIVSFRLGGTDGVSIEAAKWAWGPRPTWGPRCITVAGEGPVDHLVPGLAMDTDRAGRRRLTSTPRLPAPTSSWSRTSARCR